MSSLSGATPLRRAKLTGASTAAAQPESSVQAEEASKPGAMRGNAFWVQCIAWPAAFRHRRLSRAFGSLQPLSSTHSPKYAVPDTLKASRHAHLRLLPSIPATVPATPTTSNRPITRSSLRARDASDTPTPSTRRTVRRARTNSKHPSAPKAPSAADSSTSIDLGQAHSDQQHTPGIPPPTADGPKVEHPGSFADDGPMDQHEHTRLDRVLSFGAELFSPAPSPALVPNLGLVLGCNAAQPACSTPRLFTFMAAAANQPASSASHVSCPVAAGAKVHGTKEEGEALGGAAGVTGAGTAETGAAAGVAEAAQADAGAAVGSPPTLLELQVAELSLEDAGW